MQAFLDALEPDWAESQDVATLWVEPDQSGQIAWSGTLGDGATVQAPTGAVTEALTLAYLPLGSQPGMVGDAHDAGLRFDLGAYRDSQRLTDDAISEALTITLTYRDAGVRWLDVDTLALYVRQSGDWVDAATTCDPVSAYERDADANTVSVVVCELGEFALAGDLIAGTTLHRTHMPLALSEESVQR